MYKIDHGTAVATRPTNDATGTEGYFTEGDPNSGLVATNVTKDFLNNLQDELSNIVAQGGLTNDKADSTQVFTAINTLFLRSDINQNFNGQILNFTHGSSVLTFDGQTAPDGLGIRRITCNDGTGNWNFKSGAYSIANVESYVNATDGAAGFSINSDATNGHIIFRTAPIGGVTDGAVSWASTLTLDNNNLTLSGLNLVTNGLIDGRDIQVLGAKLDGIESNATADQTASEILTLIKTVDGAGSGLDADLLDGISTGSAVFTTAKHIPTIGTNHLMEIGRYLDFHHTIGNGVDQNARLHTDGVTNSQLFINGNKIWHAGNDGDGSGLDADLLDGANASDVAGSATIVKRQALGFIYANFFNTAPNTVTSGGNITKLCIETNNDGFIRHGDANAIRDFLKILDPGAVITVANTTLPSGYLKCNGAAVSRTTYATLFTALSTTYGAGNGSTTFNLPDLRGEFVRGWDDARGVDSGRAIGTFQADDFKSHNHLVASYAGVNAGARVNAGTVSASQGANQSSFTGGTETRPRNVAMMYVIKY